MPYPDNFSLRTSNLYPSREDELAESRAIALAERREAENRMCADQALVALNNCLAALANLPDWEGRPRAQDLVDDIMHDISTTATALRKPESTHG